MVTKASYRTTGFVFLIVGILFFLRDIGINYIGNTNLVNIIIIVAGAGLVAGGGMEMTDNLVKPSRRK